MRDRTCFVSMSAGYTVHGTEKVLLCVATKMFMSRIGGEEYNTCVLLQFLGRRVNVRHTEKEIESGTPICYLFCVCNMTFSFLSCQYSN